MNLTCNVRLAVLYNTDRLGYDVYGAIIQIKLGTP